MSTVIFCYPFPSCRSVLEDAGVLEKWDVGNIASHIGQLYYHY